MAERYSRLFTLPENLYAEGSPVIIAAGALLKDNQTGKVLAQLKLRSISEKDIQAVKVCLYLFDTAGCPIGEPVMFDYLDLRALRDAEFGQKTPIMVPESKARSYTVAVTEVVFFDKSTWTADGAEWEPLPQQRTLEGVFQDTELVKQYKIAVGSNFTYYPMQEKGLWFCACGAVNRAGKPCHICGRTLDELQAIDREQLVRDKDARLAEEARQAAEEKAAADAQRKKTAKILKIVIPVVCAVIAIAALVKFIVIPTVKYNEAVSLMNAGQYEEAIAAFEAMDGYKDSAQKIEGCKIAILEEQYSAAVALQEAGQYEEAVAAFEAMDGYKDSKGLISECKYSEALALMDAGKYEEAIAAFEAMDGYKDSAEQITNCKNAIIDAELAKAEELLAAGDYDGAMAIYRSLANAEGMKQAENAKLEATYKAALVMAENGYFKEAYNAFQNIGGYKDSPEQAQSAFTNLLNTLKVGESVLFGTYEQDDNIANGPEFVEWQVLDIQDGKILLLSKYALECARYNISPEETTWERSTVRSWLNNDFLNSAFAEEERRLIALSTVEAHKNPIYKRIDPGNDTHDHIFCLSVQEITEYLPTQTDRMCEPTEHAINRGTKLYSGNWCYWWTRTPGRDLTHAVTVAGGGEMLTSGDIYFMGSSVNIEIDAVRPALWIELNK